MIVIFFIISGQNWTKKKLALYVSVKNLDRKENLGKSLGNGNKNNATSEFLSTHCAHSKKNRHD